MRAFFILIILLVIGTGILIRFSIPVTEGNNLLIRKWVEEDYPEIKWAVTDIERVNIIRQWAYEHSTSSPNLTSEITYLPGFLNYRMEAYQMFTLFSFGNWSALCGGTGVALTQLYRAYGYEAYSLGTGNIDAGNTHEITLVKIIDHGCPITIVEDAFFDITITYVNGTPMPYTVLLGKSEAATLQKGPYSDVRIIDTVPMLPSYDWIGMYHVTNHTADFHDGFYQYWGTRALENYETDEAYYQTIREPFMIDGQWVNSSYFTTAAPSSLHLPCTSR